jgi:hypothetical protein
MNQKPPKSGIPDESDDRAFGIIVQLRETLNAGKVTKDTCKKKGQITALPAR